MSSKRNSKGHKNSQTSKAKQQAFSAEVTVPKSQLDDNSRRIIQLGQLLHR